MLKCGFASLSNKFADLAMLIGTMTWPHRNRALFANMTMATIDIRDRRPIDRDSQCQTSRGTAILNRSPAPLSVICLAGDMSCQRI